MLFDGFDNHSNGSIFNSEAPAGTGRSSNSGSHNNIPSTFNPSLLTPDGPIRSLNATSFSYFLSPVDDDIIDWASQSQLKALNTVFAAKRARQEHRLVSQQREASSSIDAKTAKGAAGSSSGGSVATTPTTTFARAPSAASSGNSSSSPPRATATAPTSSFIEMFDGSPPTPYPATWTTIPRSNTVSSSVAVASEFPVAPDSLAETVLDLLNNNNVHRRNNTTPSSTNSGINDDERGTKNNDSNEVSYVFATRASARMALLDGCHAYVPMVNSKDNSTAAVSTTGGRGGGESSSSSATTQQWMMQSVLSTHTALAVGADIVSVTPTESSATTTVDVRNNEKLVRQTCDAVIHLGDVIRPIGLDLRLGSAIPLRFRNKRTATDEVQPFWDCTVHCEKGMAVLNNYVQLWGGDKGDETISSSTSSSRNTSASNTSSSFAKRWLRSGRFGLGVSLRTDGTIGAMLFFGASFRVHDRSVFSVHADAIRRCCLSMTTFLSPTCAVSLRLRANLISYKDASVEYGVVKRCIFAAPVGRTEGCDLFPAVVDFRVSTSSEGSTLGVALNEAATARATAKALKFCAARFAMSSHQSSEMAPSRLDGSSLAGGLGATFCFGIRAPPVSPDAPRTGGRLQLFAKVSF